MIQFRWIGKWLVLTGILSALCFACTAGAQVTVTPTVTYVNGLYHYDYSITNTSVNDVFLVDVLVNPQSDAVQNLLAPSGFQAAFDPGLGLVSFLEDSDVFGPNPVSGFTFDSPISPGNTSFNATFLDPNGNLGTLSGGTLGPAVPEPGSLTAFAAFALSGAFWVRRRIRK